MLKINVNKINFEWKNTIISRVINLDTHLDMVVLLSVKDTSFWDLFLNKILDSTIDRIRIQDVYNDFSTALENINSFLHTWKSENEKLKGVHAVIGLVFHKTLYFSTVGSPSCYLINSHHDVIEITEKEEQKKDFMFISNGDISWNETIIFGTTRLLHYLSKGDLSDSARLDEVLDCNDNLESILKNERITKNIGLITLRVDTIIYAQESKFSQILYKFTQLLDNQLVKQMYAYIKFLQKKIVIQSKTTKNIIFSIGIWVSFLLLYFVISSFVSLSSTINNSEQAKQDLFQARELVRSASENIGNPDMFSLYIEESEKLIQSIQTQQLFLNDVTKIFNDISILKQQFNGIETFTATDENTLYTSENISSPVKVLSISSKIYFIDKEKVIGPIVAGAETQENIFEQFSEWDFFIDATVQGNTILLLTDKWKVVSFSNNNFFSYVDVLDQPTWEDSHIIDSYASNIYLLNKLSNQIFRHKKIGNNYDTGISYLTEQDSKTIDVILDIAIDWGIYILKNDLSLVKLFVSPKYRLETITLNQLPRNYERESIGDKVSIYTANNLNYFYMLLNNRVLIFQPNTNRYQDVKSMKYIWQVEARDFKIQDFYVENDGEIFLLGDTGLYKMMFEVSDDQFIIR